MSASLGRMSFRVQPLWTGLISTLLSLAGSKHNCTLQLAFGSRIKLLYHSAVSSTSNGTIMCCFCSLSSSSLSGCCGAYDTILGGVWYGWWLSFTLRLNVPLKHPIPVNTLLNLLFSFCVIDLLASLSSSVFVLELK